MHPNLQKTDKEIFNILKSEEERQTYGIELIPSENYASAAVMEATGSVFTNKYSEGYPGKRYYGGQENVDKVEQLAVERAKQLFGVDHVNVQSYSGSPANMAVYFGLLEYGDTIMGLKLDHGGHITHGLPISFSGRTYNVVPYEVEKDTGRLNMDMVREQALKHKPKLIIAGYTAYPRIIDWKAFKEIGDHVGAILMADIAHIAGLIAGGVHPSPVPHFDVITTTTHKTLRGPRGAMIMCKEQYAKDIDKAVFPGLQGGPHDNTTAAKAVAFGEALQPEFKDYAAQIVNNARALANKLMEYGFNLVSGGTDNHLILIDLTSKQIPGKVAQECLDKIGLTTNKNTIPFDPRPPFDPSGLRLGTPAITTRGMKEQDMQKIATWITAALEHYQDDEYLNNLKNEVRDFCKNFPVPGIKI
ncbi:serine hydroxymethyltransferase [Candidatus Peregrinibacteria bacterium]|nr:serine hydroxymethyltransferase [Candidatus Peregrinibacteria bacterium]